jgi:hypothetical protein
MYWASGASHGPHLVMKEWVDKYKRQTIDVKWLSGIGPAMAARIAWSAARAPALV